MAKASARRLVSVSKFTTPDLAPPVDPARNPTRAVAFWLRRDIVRGVFAPNERLKVALLTKFYEVGHSPIREAILLLTSSGLIVHEHQKGYRIAPVSLADYDDVVNVYQRIYRLALEIAVKQGDDGWEERVVLALHRSSKVRKVLPDGNPEARELWQRSYRSFHSVLLSGCGSPLLLGIFENVADRIERYVNIYGDLEADRARDHHAEHRVIVEALLSRDLGRLMPLIDTYYAGGEALRSTVPQRLPAGDSADDD